MVNRYDIKERIGLLIYPFFICLLSTQVNAQSAYTALLDLSFDQSRAISDSKSKKGLHDLYVEHLTDCAQLILAGNEALYETFTTRFEERIKAVESFPEEATKGFYSAEIRLQWAFVATKYQDQWTAFWSLRKAKLGIEENRAQYPGFHLNSRTLGLMQVVLDLIPENRQWMLSLFGMRGDFQAGYQQLKAH